jgi:ubiquinol-cytochrome c reductase cytochrome c subunit
VGSLGGPGVPRVDPSRGNLAEGQQLFTQYCSGCHQVVARGGIVTGASVPTLLHASPTQVAEAVRIGPYLMPRFGPKLIGTRQLDSIARYVVYAKQPDNRGGWALFDIGPVPEGLVSWLLAGAALLAVIRLIGKRADE